MRICGLIMAVLLVSSAAWGVAAKNPVIYAPQIGAITIDGNLA